MNFLVTLVILISSLVSHSGASVWRWKFNSNFNNSENWDRHQVPCRTSVVVFPPDSMVPVELPVKSGDGRLVEIKKLVVSRQGFLSFPRTEGGIVLSGESRHSSCEGGETMFLRTSAERWADPDSWFPQRGSVNEATPHLERIPCATDRVEFSEESSFFIKLPRRRVTLAALKILGETFEDTHQLKMALEAGAHRFFPGILSRDFDSVRLTGESCGDTSGCECGNSVHFEDVCTGKWSWQEARCADPVTPIGFCYPICGAYLLYKAGSVSEVQSVVKKYFAYEGIVSHTSKVNGFIQVVLVEQEKYSGFIGDYAENLNQELVKRGIVKGLSSSLHYSGLKTNPVEASSILGRFFLALLCAAFAFALLFCSQDKNRLTGRFNLNHKWLLQRNVRANETVGFARFENAGGTIEICEEVLPPSMPSVTGQNLGFDNPMFSQVEKSSHTDKMDSKKDEWRPFSSEETDEESSDDDPDIQFREDISMKDVELDSNIVFEPVNESAHPPVKY